MTNSIVGLIIGLLLGVYFTASYPDAVISDLQKIHVPLLATTAHTPTASTATH